ncbi:MAG: ABC transporter permease [Fibrobacterota bacterium]
MLSYALRRILYMIPLVIGVTLITFLLFNVVGQNPAYQMLGKGATAEEIENLEHQLGIDRPLAVQYLDYLGSLLRMDFGRSWSTRQKISSMIKKGMGPSLMLAVPAFFFSTIISLIIAMIAVYYRYSILDRALVVLSVMGMSISTIVYIIAGQYFFSFKLGLFPVSGFEYSIRAVSYLVLPVLIWVVASAGANVRFYRTVIIEESGNDFVLTARAKGLSGARIMVKHIMKNALIPIITQLIMTLPFLFLGNLFLEDFFGIPGLGNMSINAINDSDFPVIQAMTFIGALLYMGANLAGDLLYGAVNPRVRYD